MTQQINNTNEESKERFMERLKGIANLEGLAKSELILDEANYFYDKHHSHGYELILLFLEEGLNSIYLECNKFRLSNNEQCPEAECSELSYSIIYNRYPVAEIGIQRERRQQEGYD